MRLFSVLYGNAGGNDSNIQWAGNNWAKSCDFPGNDMSNVQISGEDCGGLCANTSNCTHFTWTTYLNGTCWLKSGPVSKNDAILTTDLTMVCGVVRGQSNRLSKCFGVPTTNSAITADHEDEYILKLAYAIFYFLGIAAK
ncbi:unnamed protein product [Rotaria socialis]|uniref:Apple domain-containing protein n=1 Tax=Rotaria socialis TaxID=392032 RepID=A0A818L6C7_9BILA|nr:unnamed protein product [Rotaria socialis]